MESLWPIKRLIAEIDFLLLSLLSAWAYLREASTPARPGLSLRDDVPEPIPRSRHATIVGRIYLGIAALAAVAALLEIVGMMLR